MTCKTMASLSRPTGESSEASMKLKVLACFFRLCLLSMLASQSGIVSANVQISGENEDALVVKPVSDDNHLGLGYSYLEAGKYRQALLEFNQGLEEAGTGGDAARLAEIHAAAGYALYLLQSHEPAIAELRLALDQAAKIHEPRLEGRVRGYIGLVYAESEDNKHQAVNEFARSQALARESGDWALVYATRLQLARLQTGPAERAQKLAEIVSELQSAQMEDKSRVNLLLNVIDQLKHLQEDKPDKALGVAARQLGYSVAETAAALAAKADLPREQAQIEAYLGGLYERDGKTGDALRVTGLAIRRANSVGAEDLAMTLQASRGRLLARQGQEEQAIEAYRLAEFHVGEVRNDIPMVYQNGKSSFSETLEPIYRGLADLLLRSASRAKQQDDRQRLLLEAINALEKLKQSELEDYFNDRCALDTQSTMSGSSKAAANLFLRSTPPGETIKYGPLTTSLTRAAGKTAILYPIMFDDRMELLLVNNGTIRQKTMDVSREKVTQQAVALSNILRRGKDYWIPSRQLYQWIVSPLEGDLQTADINRIVYIPDGILRLAPLAAFNNGRNFVAEHYEVVTNSVLQSTLAQTEKAPIGKVLLAGLSVPDGPSLDEIPKSLLPSGTADDSPSSQRSASGTEKVKGDSSIKQGSRENGNRWASPELRAKTVERLSLPGVTEEIHSIEKKLPNKTLLNQTFTSQNLEEGIQSGDHQVVHISSHGYFGHSAKESFIMTYDKNLGVGEVERIMRINQGQGQPVDLVTFSACETAQGDERAPLGFSGLAIKASARNAMGALWPISDDATKHFMQEYYSALSSTDGDTSKSLHLAQLAMLHDKTLAHPSYWAAFILVGAW
jgi:CHAT domain-containing protein